MPRFNTQHYFNFLSTHAITPSSTSLPGHRFVNALCTETSGGRNAAFHVIRKRISSASKRTQTCGKFPPSHQNFKSQFFTSFCSTFRALCHFLRERVWDIYHRIYFGWERRRRTKRGKAWKQDRIRIGREWQTSLKQNEATEKWKSFSEMFFSLKLPKLKLPFTSSDAPDKVEKEKISGKSSEDFKVLRFVFNFNLLEKWFGRKFFSPRFLFSSRGKRSASLCTSLLIKLDIKMIIREIKFQKALFELGHLNNSTVHVEGEQNKNFRQFRELNRVTVTFNRLWNF